MRAFALDEYGVPGSVRDLPDPTPGEGEVLVRVTAAGVNPADAGIAAGTWKSFMQATFPLVPGSDVAGVVEAVGSGVDAFRPGDAVFGTTGRMTAGAGTFAELVTASAATIARRPEALDAMFAGALPLVAASGLQMLDAAPVGEGDLVVVTGATGGIGSIVVPLLRATGATVIAVSRAANHSYARSRGAAETFDYETDDVAAALRNAHPEGITAIFDTSANRDLVGRLAEQVRSGGHVVSMAGAADAEALTQRGITATNIRTQPTAELLDRAAMLATDGTIPCPQIRTYPLADAGAALADAGSRHTRGKLLVVP
jgi:NADPH:quinone reductase-like Zn-dependent oxidoreductase